MIDSIIPFFKSPLMTMAITPALFVVALLYVSWRIRSLNVVRAKVWRTVIGEQDVRDPTIGSYLQDMHDLDAFRFRSGVKLERLADARRLLSFAKDKGVPISAFARVSPYIDVTQPTFLKIPTKRNVVGYFVFFVVSFALLGFSLQATVSSETLLVTKATKINFIATPEQARSVFLSYFQSNVKDHSTNWTITPTYCMQSQEKIKAQTGLNSVEVDAICSSLLDGSMKSKLEGPLKFQRWAAGILTGILLIATLAMTRLASIGAQTRRLGKKLID